MNKVKSAKSKTKHRKPGDRKALKTNKKDFMKENKYIAYIFALFISAFIIITPFYRGLFFRENYILAIACLSFIYMAYLFYQFYKRDSKAIDTYMDIAALAIPFSYFVSFLFSVNAKSAFDSILIHSSYFMIYRMAFGLAKDNERLKKLLLDAVIASAFVTALASLLTLSGTLELNGVVVGNRLFGLYQYPNTSASIFAIAIVLAINSIGNTNDVKLKLLYQLVLTTLFPMFIFTLSRGGYLTLAVILLLNFLILDGHKKLALIINFIIPNASASLFIYRYFTEGQASYTNIMKDYTISIFIALALTFVIYLIDKKVFKDIPNKAINIVLTSIVLLVAIAIGFLISVKEPIEYTLEHLPGEEEGWKSRGLYIDDIEKESNYSLSYEVKSSKKSEHSFMLTLRSYNKANEHEELYRELGPLDTSFEKREFTFTSLDDTERILILIYNHDENSETVYKDIRLLDDMGNLVKDYMRFTYIPDTIANRLTNIKLDDNSASSRILFTRDGIKIFKDNIFVGAGGGGWENLYRQYQEKPYNTTEVHNFYVQYAIEVGLLGIMGLLILLALLLFAFINGLINKSEDTHIFLAVFLIFAHSAIDFNLSLIAVGYILWFMIGILNTSPHIKRFKALDKKWHAAVLSLGLVVFAFSLSRSYGINQAIKASDISDSDIDGAMKHFEKAIRFDPYNSYNNLAYAQLLNIKTHELEDYKYYEKMLEQIEIARKSEPYNYRYASLLTNLYTVNGDLDKAINFVDERFENEPMQLNSYLLRIDLNFEIAKHLFLKEEYAASIAYLENILETQDKLREINKLLDKPIVLPKDYDEKLELTRELIEQARAGTGQE